MVVRLERRVGPLHAGVDVGDDDTGAAHTVARPDLRRAEVIHAPLDRVDRGVLGARQGGGDGIDLVSGDLGDFGPTGQLVERGAVGGDLDRVGDPEGLVRLAPAL